MAVRIFNVVGLFVIFGLCSALALGDQDEKDLNFLDSIKNLEAFDDAEIQDQVLVLWPNPKTQNFLDFEGGPPIFKQYMTCTVLLKKQQEFNLQGFM